MAPTFLASNVNKEAFIIMDVTSKNEKSLGLRPERISQGPVSCPEDIVSHKEGCLPLPAHGSTEWPRALYHNVCPALTDGIPHVQC